MSKSLSSQLKDIEKVIQKRSMEYQSKLNQTSKEKWFTNEFMESVHSLSIDTLFAQAGVDISHINSLTNDEVSALEKVIPPKFQTWNDFLEEAFSFNVKKFISTQFNGRN